MTWNRGIVLFAPKSDIEARTKEGDLPFRVANIESSFHFAHVLIRMPWYINSYRTKFKMSKRPQEIDAQ